MRSGSASLLAEKFMTGAEAAGTGTVRCSCCDQSGREASKSNPAHTEWKVFMATTA